ncbi:MAG: leucyl/phenylalanyl-tRNA--protein transferase [Phycisphaerae bacterium]|nr:leucyl/phenylalanyl-tRNA--protein transferase [Phycisphaerae bacterium]
MSRRTASSSDLVQALLNAYRRGFFPMACNEGPWTIGHASNIQWFSPDPRGILPLDEADGFHVPRRLLSRMRQNPFDLRLDTAFEAVMLGCAAPRKESEDDEPATGTWIDDTILAWYRSLHQAGHAHSIEAWARDPREGRDRLVGGLYGVSIGAAFFGESMFHLPLPRRVDGSRHPLDGTDASKVCLVTLVRALARAGFALFDTQMVTSHVARFGGREIPRREYLRRLEEAAAQPDRWAGVRL